MATRRKTNRVPKNTQCETAYCESPLQTVTTTKVFHVTNDRGEHSFHAIKRDLLNYLASTHFRAVSIVEEDVPLSFAFGR